MNISLHDDREQNGQKFVSKEMKLLILFERNFFPFEIRIRPIRQPEPMEQRNQEQVAVSVIHHGCDLNIIIII